MTLLVLQSHAAWCAMDFKINQVDHRITRFLTDAFDIVSTTLVKTLVQDLVDLVYRKGIAVIKTMPSRSLFDRNAKASARQALDRWKTSPIPFCAHSPLEDLITIGFLDVDELLSGKIKLTWSSLATTLSEFITKPTLPTKHALFTKGGRLRDTCAIARPTITYHLSRGSLTNHLRPQPLPRIDGLLPPAISRSLQELRVYIIPGLTSSRKISTTKWISIQDDDLSQNRIQPDDPDDDEALPQRKKARLAAQKVLSLQANDPAVSWWVVPRMDIAASTRFIGGTRLPGNVDGPKRSAGQDDFQLSLALEFKSERRVHRIAVYAALLLAPLLPNIKVEHGVTSKQTFRTTALAEEFLRGPSVKFSSEAKLKGVTAPIPWIEAFLLGWMFWLAVRDGKCGLGTERRTPEYILKAKLGMSFTQVTVLFR